MKTLNTKQRRYRVAALVLSTVAVIAVGCTADRDGQHPTKPMATTADENRLPAAMTERLKRVLSVYEEIRADLAGDRMEGLADQASRLAQALDEAANAAPADRSRVKEQIHRAKQAAESIAAAQDLAAARIAFADLSLPLMTLAGADPSWVEGWHAFSCPMVEGFNRWMQPSAELENPYMGQAMPSCGSRSNWDVGAGEPETDGGHGHSSGEIAHYTCSMHPSVKRAEPGTCPICSMDLTPVTRDELESGVIFVDAQRRQLIGLRTAAVQDRAVRTRVRAVGRVVYDERRLADVTVKYRGWIGTLHVDKPGQKVNKGETLFTLYSPELYAAQEEYLTALASQRAAQGTSAPDRADYLVESARKRLHLWDVRDWQIDRLAEAGTPLEHLPIVSPVTGYVVEKKVVEGAAVEPGSRLYRIAGLDRVWVEAEVYESDLSMIETGQTAEIDISYLPDRSFTGQVSFVYPYLDPDSRTGRVRIELANPGLRLKPDMYADVVFEIDRGNRLVVPPEAVLFAGPRRLVFLDLGEGRLRPQEIEIGIRTPSGYEVLDGLEAGDVVVTSGNFLVAAESRLKSATEMW